MSPVRHVLYFSRGSESVMVVYGLNCKRLKYSVAGQYWKSMEDCFRDICTFGAGYERTKGYSRADFNVPETSAVNICKSTKDPGPCFGCSGSHQK